MWPEMRWNKCLCCFVTVECLKQAKNLFANTSTIAEQDLSVSTYWVSFYKTEKKKTFVPAYILNTTKMLLVIHLSMLYLLL